MGAPTVDGKHPGVHEGGTGQGIDDREALPDGEVGMGRRGLLREKCICGTQYPGCAG